MCPSPCIYWIFGIKEVFDSRHLLFILPVNTGFFHVWMTFYVIFYAIHDMVVILIKKGRSTFQVKKSAFHVWWIRTRDVSSDNINGILGL